jgi:hypothetical protein
MSENAGVAINLENASSGQGCAEIGRKVFTEIFI